jgi:hypothetical protein
MEKVNFDMTQEQLDQTIRYMAGGSLNIRKVDCVIQDVTEDYKNLFTTKAYEFIDNKDNKSNSPIHQYLELIDGDTFLEWDLSQTDRHLLVYAPSNVIPVPPELKGKYFRRATQAKYTSVIAIGEDSVSKAAKILVDNFNSLVEKDEVLKVLSKLFIMQVDSNSVKPTFIMGLFFHTRTFYKPEDSNLSIYSHEGRVSSVVVGE